MNLSSVQKQYLISRKLKVLSHSPNEFSLALLTSLCFLNNVFPIVSSYQARFVTKATKQNLDAKTTRKMRRRFRKIWRCNSDAGSVFYRVGDTHAAKSSKRMIVFSMILEKDFRLILEQSLTLF